MTRHEAPEGLAQSAGKLDSPQTTQPPRQPGLFDPPEIGRTRTLDPETSKAAARRFRAPERERQILTAMVRIGAHATSDDIADACTVRIDIVRSRLAAMRRRLLVEVDGRGPARGDTAATVQTWCITDLGRDHLREISRVAS